MKNATPEPEESFEVWQMERPFSRSVKRFEAVWPRRDRMPETYLLCQLDARRLEAIAFLNLGLGCDLG